MQSLKLRLLLLSSTVNAISYNYISRPDLHAAPWNITFLADNADLVDAYVFIAPDVVQPTGLMIYENNGEPVFIANNTLLAGATNFRVQPFEGENYLTFWAGNGSAVTGHGVGTDFMLKQDYTTAFTFAATNYSDLHEFEFGGQNTAVVTHYQAVGGVDTSSVPGGIANSFVFDGCFQDIDPKTGQPQFTFCSLEGGISINETFVTPIVTPNSTDNAWDYLHPNSVGKDALGNYLLSGRFAHAFFYIDGRTGEILWRLGGKFSDFTGNGTDFKWQHHGRFVGETNATAAEVRAMTKRRISIFDNHANFNDLNATQSRGLLVEIDFTTNTTSIIQEYSSPGGEDNLLTLAAGSVQFLHDETFTNSTNVLVSYGTVPAFAEYTQDGKGLRVVHYGDSSNATDYRIFKKAWVGKPKTAPDAAIQNNTIFVSWNGATEVKEWSLLQGNEFRFWSNVTNVTRTGFETSIGLADYTFVQVAALDSSGKVLGKTFISNRNGTIHGGAVNGTGL